ncbi:hypothetical protein [Paenibacillus radicis (ex Gao et al. 2016)]|uniref:Phospholipase C/D domain-containing protein n=1 Tax=Paenibacillus radicis (ex Gao et al. 2016) TaxID=1737354 RepID=A0A917LX43_9BACL|nr:hypothetical protein [Paenibacillus radicis (ex Gao et al. 2016)]GGG61139.1 hypothetical protein GCM10010918_13180 [Paenibacillus radicis (ex Gao et al. 2016)]
MPWPMVHFAVAEEVCTAEPSPHFLLGSIAPDAIHRREASTREDKKFTHLFESGKFSTIERLKDRCLHYWVQNTDAEWRDFVRGYFAHIYTDIKWTQTLYSPFAIEYQGERDEAKRVYYKEVSQLEFILLRNETWGASALERLRQASGYGIEPLVTQTEVEQYRDDKLQWFADQHNEPGIELVFFTEAKVKPFASQTAAELRQFYKEWGMDSSTGL